jgi:hypothetical protein
MTSITATSVTKNQNLLNLQRSTSFPIFNPRGSLQNRPRVDVSKPATESGLRQVLFYPAEVGLGKSDLISQWCVKLKLFPPGSRLAETSRADDAGLAPRESAIETLCR